MNILGYRCSIEHCVKSLYFDCVQISGIEPNCFVKVYYNIDTHKYRAISDLYYFNKISKEKVIFESRNCDYEEEAVNNLFIKFNAFYQENGALVMDEENATWIGRQLPSFRF